MMRERKSLVRGAREGAGEFVAVNGRGSLPPEVLTALVANRGAFLAFVRRRTRDSRIAEDVLHDAFGKAMTTMAAVREPEAATAWFYRLLRNGLVDHQRRATTREKTHAVAAGEVELVVATGGEAERAICRCVARLIDSLPQDLALAIRRIDVDGVETATYAAEAGITANNARVRLFRARTSLRARLQSACGACAADRCGDCSCNSSL